MKQGWYRAIGLFFCISVSVGLSGCVSDFLGRYAEYDYTTERGTRLCHPFWDCQQGQWMRVGKSDIDTIVDHALCEGELEVYGEWFDNSVSQGLEARRCMEIKGYALQYPIPFRR